jgi:hypothetical protein
MQVLGFFVLAFGLLVATVRLINVSKARQCCSITDPRRDLRMRGAFEDESSASPR